MYHQSFQVDINSRFNDHIFICSEFPNFHNLQSFRSDPNIDSRWKKRTILSLVLVEDGKAAKELYEKFEWKERGITVYNVPYDEYESEKKYPIISIHKSDDVKLYKKLDYLKVRLFYDTLHLVSIEDYNSDVIIGEKETLCSAVSNEYVGDSQSLFQNILYKDTEINVWNLNFDLYEKFFNPRMYGLTKKHFIIVGKNFDNDGFKLVVAKKNAKRCGLNLACTTRFFTTITVTRIYGKLHYHFSARSLVVYDTRMDPRSNNIKHVIPRHPYVKTSDFYQARECLRAQKSMFNYYNDVKNCIPVQQAICNFALNPSLNYQRKRLYWSLINLTENYGAIVEFPELLLNVEENRNQFCPMLILCRRICLQFADKLRSIGRVNSKLLQRLKKCCNTRYECIGIGKGISVVKLYSSVQDLTLDSKLSIPDVKSKNLKYMVEMNKDMKCIDDIQSTEEEIPKKRSRLYEWVRRQWNRMHVEANWDEEIINSEGNRPRSKCNVS